MFNLTQLLVAQEDTVANCNSIFSTIKRIFLDKKQADEYNNEGLKLYDKNYINESRDKHNQGLSCTNENKCLEITAHLYHNLGISYDTLEIDKLKLDINLTFDSTTGYLFIDDNWIENQNCGAFLLQNS